jgi:hypothetical protein
MSFIEARVVSVPRKPGKIGKPEPDEGDRAATAAYVASLVADLSTLARKQKLDTLGYLLDMARLEAEGSAQASESDREDATDQD